MPKTKIPLLSIVIPAYNEAGNIEKVVKESYKYAKKLTNDFEIIVCDDGSVDKTGKIVKRYQRSIPQLKLITNKKNLGLGQTLIRLLRKSRGKLIQTFPGDFQMRPRELPKFYKAIQNADLVCGYRKVRKDSLFRVIISKVYNLFVRALFGIKVNDLGTIKMMRRVTLKKIKPKTKTNFIEAEIVIKAYQAGFSVGEVPINYYPRVYGKETGANPIIIFKTFFALFKFFFAKA